MTIAELIEQLEYLSNEYGSETEVKMAYQPNYPLQAHIAGVAVVKNDGEHTVYIAEQTGNDYAPREIWDEID